MKKYKAWIIGIISLALLIPISIIGYEKYEEYKLVKELEEEIASIEMELDKLDAGDYSSIEPAGLTSLLSLSNFSASSDGTYVNAYGSVTNTSTQYIDEIGEIAFFNTDGSINRVIPFQVQLGAGEVLYFEELIGLTSEGTVIPSSAELTGF